MKKFSGIKKENVIICFIILTAVFLFWLPFIPKGMVNGWEIAFQYSRVLTLIQSLQEGIFPAKLRPMHMKGYGYGVGFFYPDFFIYPAAIAAYLGVDPEVATKFFTVLIIVTGSFVSYKLYEKDTENRFIALIGVILLIGSRINYKNYILGAGFPHLCAYLFMPMAIMGLLHGLKGEKRGYIAYAFGLASVVLSHHLIFLTMIFTMVIIVIYHIGEIIKNPKPFGILLAISFADLAFTTAYWLPALEQAMKIKLIALYDNSYDITEHILSLGEIVFTEIGLPMFVTFIAACIVYLVLMFRGVKMGTDIGSLFITNLILLVVSCNRMLWLSGFGTVFGFFQYTERFIFVMTVLMITFIVMVIREVYRAYQLSFLEDKRAFSVLGVVFLLVLTVITRCDNKPDFFNLDSYSRSEYGYELLEKDYNVSGAEWLPMECEPSECKTPNTSKADDGSGAEGFKHDHDKYYEVWVDLSKNYYDVPYVYYYGYKAYIVDDNMNPTRELAVGEAIDDNGLTRVYMPQEEGFGHIMVTYRKTTVQKVSYVISIISFLAIVAASLILWKKDKSLHK